MGEGFKPDPAIEKWATMRETTHLYFRPRPKSVAWGLLCLVAVPIGLYYGLTTSKAQTDEFLKRVR